MDALDERPGISDDELQDAIRWLRRHTPAMDGSLRKVVTALNDSRLQSDPRSRLFYWCSCGGTHKGCRPPVTADVIRDIERTEQ